MTQLDPIAHLMLDAYADTATYSRQFRDWYSQPPTTLAKAHHLRSIVQARVNESDHYELGPAYSEYGRVELRDLKTDQSYLLRSNRAIVVEDSMTEMTLFGEVPRFVPTSVMLLVFNFRQVGLDLSVAPSKKAAGKSHLKAAAPAAFVGTWPYSSADGPDDEERGFSQAATDAWEELGRGIEDAGQGET